MERMCKQCDRRFEVTQDDLAFFEKVSPVFGGKKEPVPPPTLCPECRQRVLLSFRNENHLYHGICDLSKQPIISVYSSGQPFQVYGTSEWHSDNWNPHDFAQTYEPTKSFFSQFSELFRCVPRLALVNSGSENSDYANWVINLKNCYLLSASRENQDCYYGHWLWRSKNCTDVSHVFDSELCYECVDCSRCYKLIHSQDCRNCSDSQFLQNCSDCSQCFGCIGLQRKKYCFFNEQLDSTEYNKRTAALLPMTSARNFEILKRFGSMDTKPRKYYHGFSTEKSTGDYMDECKDCDQCFDISGSERCAFGEHIMRCKDTVDCARTTLCELSYDCLSAVNSYGVLFSVMCWYCQDVLYSDACLHSQHLFGCIGLKHKQYCILNKQYTKEEYEQLVPKIVSMMRETGEWGEFFPASLSPFAYNETVAQEYFPLTKEAVLQRGWKWRDQSDEIPKVSKVIPAAQLPGSIDDIPDDILNWAIQCEATKRPFKIIRQELEFYRQMKLPIPHFHPDERHRRRMALRNPRKLWQRPCMKCRKEMETTYAPDRPEIVYCEDCYLKEVY